GLEGPYETDATRGGQAAMKYINKRKDWPEGSPYSFSAIAQPRDIETTHTERIAPWREEPQGDQRTWEDVSDQDEHDEFRDKVMAYHREHGGRLPFRLAAVSAVPRTGPTAPAEDDHPEDRDWGKGLSWSLQQVPIERLWPHESECPGGRHGAHCYAADRFETGQRHDVSSPEYDDHDNVTWEDAQYVRKMAEHPGQLPPLVVRPGGGIFGGGHRLAAWRDAGWTHAPAWVPDSQRTAAAGERLLASFDWSGLTHGRYDVPTGAVHALRQHDDLNSGKHPHLADEIAERGIEQPLEVSLHDDGRVVLRGGSHRVNIAHSLGYPTVPVQGVDMRTREKTAKVWAPNQGIFGPTTGLDTRLFGGEELRPEVRRDLMERLDRALRVDTQLVGSEWQGYLRVYIAGGSASEWAGGRPNETAQDLDVLIGVDYQAARGHAFE